MRILYIISDNCSVNSHQTFYQSSEKSTRRVGNTIVFNGEIYNYIEIKDELNLSNHCFYENLKTQLYLAVFDSKHQVF